MNAGALDCPGGAEDRGLVLAAAAPYVPAFSPAETTCVSILRRMAGPDGARVPVQAWRQAWQAPDNGIMRGGKPESRRQVSIRAIQDLEDKGAEAIRDGMTGETGRSTLGS